MSSPLRSCEEDEGMAVNSEGGDFDEEEEDDGELDENASDINSPVALRETAAAAAPGTVHAPAEDKHAHTLAQTRTNKRRTAPCSQKTLQHLHHSISTISSG